jgi:hypothetical protein
LITDADISRMTVNELVFAEKVIVMFRYSLPRPGGAQHDINVTPSPDLSGSTFLVRTITINKSIPNTYKSYSSEEK